MGDYNTGGGVLLGGNRLVALRGDKIFGGVYVGRNDEAAGLCVFLLFLRKVHPPLKGDAARFVGIVLEKRRGDVVEGRK